MGAPKKVSDLIEVIDVMSGWMMPVLGSGNLYKVTIDTFLRFHNNSYFLNCNDSIATDSLGFSYGRYHFTTCNEMISGNPLGSFRVEESEFIISKTGSVVPSLTMGSFTGDGTTHGANLVLENIHTSDDSFSSIISKGSGDQAGAHINFISVEENTRAFNMAFYTRASDAASTQHVMTINSGQRVGILTHEPDAPLHIFVGESSAGIPNASTNDFIIESNNHVGMSFLCPDDKAAAITFGSASDTVGARMSWTHDTHSFLLGTANTDDYLQFQVGNQSNILMLTGAAMGLNTVDPQGTLQVVGSGIHIDYANLNAADPGIAGQLYRDGSNFIKISSG